MTQEQARADTAARITDEGIACMRERIGVVVPQETPFNVYATTDGFRHFAHAYGDGNPLYGDDEYAAASRWHDSIAPPLFLTTMGVSEIKEIRAEIRARGAHALAGIHEFFSGDEWEWFLPVRPGDKLSKRYYLYDVEEKERSSFTGTRSVITRYRADFTNQDGQLMAVDRYLFVRAEREAAAKTKKYFDIQKPQYSDEQLARIDEAYAIEEHRGATPRYWEDVNEGEELRPMVKGPLTLTDVMVWIRGWGAGIHHSRLGWEHRTRHPKFYTRNSFGAWEVVERVHWDDEWAQKIGNPMAYDFGRMRSCYLSEIVTNWMGDAGWLWKLSTEFRRFNYLGDTTWVKGMVRRKYADEGRYVVELDVWCENQRGEVTAPGRASVLLPSRSGADVQLPLPSAKTEGTVPLIY
jgi:acyl dehydratase